MRKQPKPVPSKSVDAELEGVLIDMRKGTEQ